MENVTTFTKFVMTKVQDNQANFVVIISSLSQQRACRLPKSTVAKCRDNSQLYCDINREEGIEGCNFLKLCRDKGQDKWQQNSFVTSKIISQQRMQGSTGKNVTT